MSMVVGGGWFYVCVSEAHYQIMLLNLCILCSVMFSRCKLGSPIITNSDWEIVQCDMSSDYSDITLHVGPLFAGVGGGI